MKKLLIIPVVAIALGCATSRQDILSKETDAKTGNITEKHTIVVNRSFWDSKNTVDKIKTSNGKTQSVGMNGVGEESSGTNTTSAIIEGLKIIGASAIKP